MLTPPNRATLSRRLLSLVVLVAAVLLGPRAASADGPHEPNDSLAQATPVVTDAPVSGTIETENDQDWFVFYTKDREQITIPVMDTTAAECCDDVLFTLRDSRGKEIAYRNLDANEADTFHYTLNRGRYYLSMTGDLGFSYSFSLQPGDILTTERCFSATSARDAATRRVSALKPELRRLRSRRARMSLRRQLRTAQRRLARTRAAVTPACSP